MTKALIETKGPAPLTAWIRGYAEDRNFESVVVGPRQSGKSTLTLALAKSIDPSFDMSRVCFSAHQFLRVVNDPARKRGDVVVLEEAGVNVSRAEWYSAVNKALLFVSQTYGWKGLIVFLTLPSMRYLDTRVAMMLTAYIEVVKMRKSSGEIRFKFQTITTQMKIGMRGPEIRYERPVTYVEIAPGVRVRAVIDYFTIQMPPKDEMRRYYSLADSYKQDLSDSLEAETAKMDKMGDPFSFDKAADEIVLSWKEYVNEKGKWNVDKVCARYPIGTPKARVLVQRVEDRMREMGIERPRPVQKERKAAVEEVQTPEKGRPEVSGEKWAEKA